MMNTIKFKCTLMSDVILNVKSASEGNNNTLDFIPGGNFLGIVAASLYSKNDKDVMKIIHSGEVRFGDAHPMINDSRSLRVPSSFYYEKNFSLKDNCFIHHLYDRSNDPEKKQLKQSRNGFYFFNNEKKTAQLIDYDKVFAIKSAYDRDKRRSKDEQMYGYESLCAGAVFCFSVSSERLDLLEKVKDELKGEKRIGRSRTAQYGLVKIEECNYTEISSNKRSNTDALVYAESRLIFLDDNTTPTFQPSVQQLGFESGEIDWEKSQIRTFSYSPWNYKRMTYDMERCGIEKGSVFYVKNPKYRQDVDDVVGSYKNEGFGKVIYNPDFLNGKSGTNGHAEYAIIDSLKPVASLEVGNNTPTPLISWLESRKEDEMILQDAYELVNKFVEDYGNRFKGKEFASQWGKIRSIAMCNSKHENIVKAIKEYIGHGVAEEKWNENKRGETLYAFMTCKQMNDRNAQIVMVNLASEMAKRCRK